MANVRRGRAHLQQAVEDIALVRNEDSAKSPEFQRWKRNTRLAIQNAFHDSRKHRKEFERIRFTSTTLWGRHKNGQEIFQEGLDRAESFLKSLIDEVDNYGPTSRGT